MVWEIVVNDGCIPDPDLTRISVTTLVTRISLFVSDTPQISLPGLLLVQGCRPE